MATATKPKPEPAPAPPAPAFKTVGELLDHLGGVPPHRVLLVPTPGTATEQDVLDMDDRHDRLCELVDGVLVEKAMGFHESCLTILLANYLVSFARQGDLGVVSGPDGPLRVSPSQVRLPDLAFFSRQRFRGRKKRGEPILDLAPDLAVEVLSKSNTRREMDRKLREYFAAGTRLVWYVDPKKRCVSVYTQPGQPTLLREDQVLDGGAVLPGFTLPLRELFAELDK